MKLTLITPCFNSAAYLEETIQSVLAQEIPDLEYIVCDGASTDGTVEIIRRHAPRIAWWCSERDRGQVDALNKGFARATGDVVGFLNADDCLAPGALRRVLNAFERSPETDLFYGDVDWIDAAGKPRGHHRGDISSLAEVLDIYRVWWAERQWVQPEVFYRRALKERVGPFDERYNLAFDYDFWVRCFRAGAHVGHIPKTLVRFRLHDAQKSTAGEKAADEIREIVREHLDADPPIGRFRRRLIEAQLGYDLYQLGRGVAPGEPRPSLFRALICHPAWFLAPRLRARVQAACARRLFPSK